MGSGKIAEIEVKGRDSEFSGRYTQGAVVRPNLKLTGVNSTKTRAIRAVHEDSILSAVRQRTGLAFRFGFINAQPNQAESLRGTNTTNVFALIALEEQIRKMKLMRSAKALKDVRDRWRQRRQINSGPWASRDRWLGATARVPCRPRADILFVAGCFLRGTYLCYADAGDVGVASLGALVGGGLKRLRCGSFRSRQGWRTAKSSRMMARGPVVLDQGSRRGGTWASLAGRERSGGEIAVQ